MDLVTAVLHRIYRSAQRRHPEVLYYGDGARRQIALTFDDGPHPDDTPRLMEMLEKHRVYATFHLVGRYAERHPDLVRRIHQSGHQLALHGYRHIPFPLETVRRLGLELQALPRGPYEAGIEHRALDAQPAEPAEGLPFPPPLPGGHGHLFTGGATV